MSTTFTELAPFGIGDVFLCKASTVLVEGIPEEYQSDEKAGMDQIIPGRDLLAVKVGEKLPFSLPAKTLGCVGVGKAC